MPILLVPERTIDPHIHGDCMMFVCFMCMSGISEIAKKIVRLKWINNYKYN